MERSIHGEVLSSTFDMPSDNHIAVASCASRGRSASWRAGYDVVILLDSITRLGRAYNLASPHPADLSGGVDSTACIRPRSSRAARNIEVAVVTIIATALVRPAPSGRGHLEEFKGTGNMELRLDRRLADKRIFPATTSSRQHAQGGAAPRPVEAPTSGSCAACCTRSTRRPPSSCSSTVCARRVEPRVPRGDQQGAGERRLAPATCIVRRRPGSLRGPSDVRARLRL